jgi:hypothetical protein
MGAYRVIAVYLLRTFRAAKALEREERQLQTGS